MDHEEDNELDEIIEQKEDQNQKTFDKKDDNLLKIKKLPKNRLTGEAEKEIVVENKRKTVSKYNAMKHGKYANIPIYCNDCYYRSEEVGGNGKCGAYKKDATCSVREDIKKFRGNFDTREPDALRTIVDNNIKLLQERVMFSAFTAGMDGNLLDKATNAQLNTLHTYIKLARELQGSIKITASQEESQGNEDADFITKMFKQVSFEKKGQ